MKTIDTVQVLGVTNRQLRDDIEQQICASGHEAQFGPAADGTEYLARVLVDTGGNVSSGEIRALGERADVPVIVVTDDPAEQRSLDLLAEGADDVILSTNLDRLAVSFARATKIAMMRASSDRSQELFRAVTDHMPIELLLKDLDGRFVYANLAMQKRARLKNTDIIGHTAAELFDPSTARNIEAHDREVIETRQGSHRLSTVNERQLHVVKFPLYDVDGDISGLGTLLIDVTEQQQVLQALRDEMERNQAVLDNTIDGYFLTTLTGEILIANSAYASMVGYERDELIGMHIADFEAIGQAHEIPGHLARIVAEGDDSFETRLYHKDRHLVDCEVSATAVRLKNEDFVFSFLRDVTERNRVNESMGESESRYQSLAQLVPVGLFRTNQDGKATFVNDQWCELSGVALDVALNGTWPRAIHEHDRQRVRDHWDECVRQRRVYRDEYRYQRSPTSVVWAFCQADPEFDKAGEFGGYVGTVTNISARKQAEQSLEEYRDKLEELVDARTAELQAAVREQESFSYSVSHDLRAPLRTIDGFSHMLLDEYGNRLDSTGRDYLLRVRTASQRMGVLIDALLDLSRMSRRKMRYEHVDLSDLSREILRKLKTAEPGRPTEFKVADGLVVNGDSELLRVVLENLIGNAWKYTSKQSCTRIEIGYRTSDGDAYFVRDNGVGFDMKYVDKLFGPFQRLHNIDEYEGMGIGLATVARIIDRHGGRVWAEGAPDSGATFYFTA